ncbi:MAG: DUF421 domain-containing protein [Bryobacteraceae bacterium]|nr:DUF421 domain-containing protein [Bryobacteraceae bacterium]
MDSVLRAFSIYFIVWLLIRISGKRTLSDLTTFDFILLLVVGEATQQALLGDDFSLVNAFVVILTLVGIDIAMSYAKRKFPTLELWMEGVPLIILENGKPIHNLMKRARIEETDILEAARHLQGLERLDQIKYAVLERSGGISIIPK